MKGNLTELKKQYEALGEEIKKLDDSPFVPGWYMYWDNDQELYHIEYIKAEHAYKGACWDNIVPVTQELLNRFLPKSTLYDWSEAPDWAQWAATDSDGSVHWYELKPYIPQAGMYGEDQWLPNMSEYKIACQTPPSVNWKNSLEQRPC